MGFSMIIPTPKAKTGVIKISTIQPGGGTFKLQISIPSALFTILFKAAEKFDLLIGEGTDKGKLMLKPNVDGHFKPTFMKHSVIFRLPETPWTPQLAMSSEDPKRREAEGGGHRHRSPRLGRRRALEIHSESTAAGRTRARRRAIAGCC